MEEDDFVPYPYPHFITNSEPNCHNCIHEKDPYFVFGSVVRTLTLGAFIFLVAISWAEVAKISFQKFGCYHGEIKPENDKSSEFNAALRFALIITFVAIIVSFLVMFYVRGTKW